MTGPHTDGPEPALAVASRAIAAALNVHAPKCRHCYRPLELCDRGSSWSGSASHEPEAFCPVCISEHPCRTVRVLTGRAEESGE